MLDAGDAEMESKGPVAPPPAAPLQPLHNQPLRMKTVPVRHLQIVMEPGDEDIDLEAARPKTRADCIDGPRPCPFVGCRYHLYLSYDEEAEEVTFNFPGKEIEQLKETCALDVAARGESTLEEVGDIMDLTRERIRQIETKALHRLKNGARAKAAREEHDGQDGKFSQGSVKPRYVPEARTPAAPPPEPPKPVFYSPPAEEPTRMPKPDFGPRDRHQEDFELDELDEVEENDDEEEERDEPAAEENVEEESPTPEEKPMPKLDRPVKVTELTDREKLIQKHYTKLANKLGAKPSPLKVAQACGLEGSNGAISANVCTALKAIKRKGGELPFFEQKAHRGPDAKPGTSWAKQKERATKKSVPPPPVSEPAIPAEVVNEVPPAAMMALSSPDAMKNMLLLEKEKLQKKLTAIEVLLTL